MFRYIYFTIVQRIRQIFAEWRACAKACQALLQKNKNFSAERLVGSGGMPSSHSATVCALTTSAGIRYGVESFEFAICFILASVVMYDAIGVRQETGKQAKLLNLIMEQDLFHLDNEHFQKKLKELVGHTPLQVLAGAVLGILVAILVSTEFF